MKRKKNRATNALDNVDIAFKDRRMVTIYIGNPDEKQRAIEIEHNLIHLKNMEPSLRQQIPNLVPTYVKLTDGLPSSYIENLFKQIQTERDLRMLAAVRSVVQRDEWRTDVEFMKRGYYEAIPKEMIEAVKELYYDSRKRTREFQRSEGDYTRNAERLMFDYARVLFLIFILCYAPACFAKR